MFMPSTYTPSQDLQKILYPGQQITMPQVSSTPVPTQSSPTFINPTNINADISRIARELERKRKNSVDVSKARSLGEMLLGVANNAAESLSDRMLMNKYLLMEQKKTQQEAAEQLKKQQAENDKKQVQLQALKNLKLDDPNSVTALVGTFDDPNEGIKYISAVKKLQQQPERQIRVDTSGRARFTDGAKEYVWDDEEEEKKLLKAADGFWRNVKTGKKAFDVEKEPAAISSVTVSMPDGTQRSFDRRDPDFAQALKDGAIVYDAQVQTSSPSDLLTPQKGVTQDLQKKVIESEDALTILEEMEDVFNPEIFTWLDRAEGEILGVKEKLGFTLTPEQVKAQEDRTQVYQKMYQYLNRLFKSQGGTAISASEQKRYLNELPSKSDSPTVAKKKLEGVLKGVRRDIMRNMQRLQSGNVSTSVQDLALTPESLSDDTLEQYSIEDLRKLKQRLLDE